MKITGPRVTSSLKRCSRCVYCVIVFYFNFSKYFLLIIQAVGQGIKNVGGGVVGFASSKPKEFAHLIRNKFGSADNINNPVKVKGDLKKEIDFDQICESHRYMTLQY